MVLRISFKSESINGRSIIIETAVWCDDDISCSRLPRISSVSWVSIYFVTASFWEISESPPHGNKS